MKHKIILLSFCATLLGSMTVYGYNCPPLPEGWNGNIDSGGIGWHVTSVDPNTFPASEYPKVKWVAYDAWILQNGKYMGLGSFQCNYKGYIGDNNVVKITLGSEVSKTLAEKHAFRGGPNAEFNNNYDHDGNVGAKCKPTPNSSFYKFPPACDIVERLMSQNPQFQDRERGRPLENSGMKPPQHPEMWKEKQEIKIHIEENEKHNFQNLKK